MLVDSFYVVFCHKKKSMEWVICVNQGIGVNDFLIAILLPSKTVIKIEAHSKRIETECQGNSLADFDVQAAATEYVEIVAHVDEVHSTSAKKWPFVAKILQSWYLYNIEQSAPESETLRWVNNGYKLNKQLELWEAQEDCLACPGFLANPIFGFCIPLLDTVHLTILSLEASDLPPLNPLDTWSWTSLKCHLAWVILCSYCYMYVF